MFAIFIIFNGLESRLEKNNVTCDFGSDHGLELLGCSLAAQGSNGFVPIFLNLTPIRMAACIGTQIAGNFFFLSLINLFFLLKFKGADLFDILPF